MTFTRTVHSTTPKTSDIEIHVSTLTTEDGSKYTDIREYVVSLDQYGRGITFPASPEILNSVREGLEAGVFGAQAVS